jgi:23S rRNA pseudouridine2605 synthase
MHSSTALLRKTAMSQKELRRVLSKLGVASRKQSEELITAGKVSVNGKVVKDPLRPVFLSDKILLDDRKIKEKKLEIYALNKPGGYITTMAKDELRRKVADLMPGHQYLFPVGRLDKASRGLLLFTNDNEFADRILSSGSGIEKVYRVQVKGEFNPEHIDNMKQGLQIKDIKYSVKNAVVIRINPKTSWIEVTLEEGKNREIRKILEHLGYEVLDLIRIRIGKLELRELNIDAGEYMRVNKDMII